MTAPTLSSPSTPRWRRGWQALIRWFDTGPLEVPADGVALAAIPDRVEWTRILPFIGMHLACLGVIWVGWSPVAVLVAGLTALSAQRGFLALGRTGFFDHYTLDVGFAKSQAIPDIVSALSSANMALPVTLILIGIPAF